MRLSTKVGKDKVVVSFDDGQFDILSSSPGGGLSSSASCIEFGEGGIPLRGAPENVKMSAMSSGPTSVMAVASADLSGAMVPGIEVGTGSVSLLLALGCDCPGSAMARAAVTAAEAVVCMIQDLCLRSPEGAPADCVPDFSIAVARDCGSDLYLRGTGKHSLLGELIGKAVYEAVKESAVANGSHCARDVDLADVLKGAGIVVSSHVSEKLTDPLVKAAVSSALFLLDEERWGLIPSDDARTAAHEVLSMCGVEVERTDIVDMIRRSLS